MRLYRVTGTAFTRTHGSRAFDELVEAGQTRVAVNTVLTWYAKAGASIRVEARVATSGEVEGFKRAKAERARAVETRRQERAQAMKEAEPGAYGIARVPPETPGALICGACGRAWSQDITPAGRCPWEHLHQEAR